ncbi:response regulator [Rhizobium sp. PL01]|uniref:response regulator n=1 Tax=Rhizobium sp. PL01 TaxID=3085631 RepID=UPI002981D318|nr:response regulator [Rhizobium sp. PL01]MDW5318503.1 response regulator [Rhizobium sp. PL01]
MSLFDPFLTVVSVTDVILMVEDEPFIAIDMEETLLKAGYTVEARSSRTDALKWLSHNTPTVAILDIHLKDGDGTEIALILQARGVPIIFCSGGSPNDLPEDFRAASWVHKPYMDGELLRAVSNATGTAMSVPEMEARP